MYILEQTFAQHTQSATVNTDGAFTCWHMMRTRPSLSRCINLTHRPVAQLPRGDLQCRLTWRHQYTPTSLTTRGNLIPGREGGWTVVGKSMHSVTSSPGLLLLLLQWQPRHARHAPSLSKLLKFGSFVGTFFLSLSPLTMGDSGAKGAFSRRRTATLAERRTASLLAVDTLSAAAGSAGSRGGQGKERDRSLETAGPKNEKQRGRNDLGDRLRWAATCVASVGTFRILGWQEFLAFPPHKSRTKLVRERSRAHCGQVRLAFSSSTPSFKFEPEVLANNWSAVAQWRRQSGVKVGSVWRKPTSVVLNSSQSFLPSLF